MRSWATSLRCSADVVPARRKPGTEVLGREPRTCVRLAARRAAARCRQRQSRVRASDWAQDDSRLVGAQGAVLVSPDSLPGSGGQLLSVHGELYNQRISRPHHSPANGCAPHSSPTTHRHHREPGPSAHLRHKASATGAGTMSVRRVSHARASRISPPPSPAPRWLGRGDVVRVGYGILCRSLPRVVCSVAARASDYRLPPKAPRISFALEDAAPLPRGQGRRNRPENRVPRPCHP